MPAGVTNAALSHCVAADGTCWANDAELEVITVTAIDEFGDPCPGVQISLAATANGAGVTIAPANVDTNAAGVATFTVKSSDLHGAFSGVTTFTATDDDNAVTVTETANVSFEGRLFPTLQAIGFLFETDSLPLRRPTVASVWVDFVGIPAIAGCTVTEAVVAPPWSAFTNAPAALVSGTPGEFTMYYTDIAAQLDQRLMERSEVLTLSANDYTNCLLPAKLIMRMGGPPARGMSRAPRGQIVGY